MLFEAPPSYRVLLVDHDRTTLEMAQIRLEVAGYTVFAARNGGAALDLLEREEIDGVVLERHLAAMASLQVLEALGSRLPVLLVGRGLTDEDIEAAAGYGVCGGLMKPFSGADLLERVDRLLAGGAPAPAPVEEEAWEDA